MKTKLYSLIAALMVVTVLGWPMVASARDFGARHCERGYRYEHVEHDRGWWGRWHDRDDDDGRYFAPPPYAYNWNYGNYYGNYPVRPGWWLW